MLHRHATDVVSLVAGTIFAGLTAVWLLNLSDVIDLESAWLAGPLVLIIAGVVGLVAALRPSRPSATTGFPESAETAIADPEPTARIEDDLEAPLGGESADTASAGEEPSRDRTD